MKLETSRQLWPRGGVSLWGTVLKGAVREGFSEEVTFKLRGQL